MHVQINPVGNMRLLSHLEIQLLQKQTDDSLYELYKNCSLAVLNAGSDTDNAEEIFEQFKDFSIEVVRRERGVKIALSNPPAQAFVDGKIIKGIKEHLSAVLRDILYTNFRYVDVKPTKVSPSDKNTHIVFDILRNAKAIKPDTDANLITCWGGHSIRQHEYKYTKEVGYQLGLRKFNICTGCGPGAMKGPMKGANVGHAKQRITTGRYIGLTEPSIIAAEPPNPIVNELVIMPDIEKRLEGFVRMSHGIIIFPGGPGTAEELLYILGILLHPNNAQQKLPIILTGPSESKAYFEEIDAFIGATLGPKAQSLYQIIVDDPAAVAQSLRQGLAEVFMALCSGATLVVAKPEQLLPGDPLMETLTEQSISHISLPSAVLATLPQNVPTPDLQTVIVGGDILPVGLANHWSTRCRLINAYGPSESAVCVTNYEHKVTDDTVVPIGKPLVNTQIFILNEHMQPVPIGTPGEIYIGGAGLGVGYLNQKALSAEKFVDNPLSNFEGNKLYRTGDLGYWREDGNIVFAGRIDFQVKIRGFRIELGEIEHQLSQHEGIKDVAVIATGESAEDKFLVAYYTPLPNIDVDEAALKHWLTLQLSDYMIPSVFVALEALPLTNNGKLDRKALPAPQRKNLSDNYVAPTNETEAQLCEIWQRYLHVDKVGIHDAFFDMGGNSLMIVKLHAELKALYATPLVIADYFQYTTVSQLAAYINAGPSSKSKRVTTSASRADKRRKRMANTRKSRVERQK